MVMASISGFGTAVPAVMDQQGLWDGFFAQHYDGSRVAERVWQSSGVTTRHGVIDPRVEDISGWGTGARMQRYMTEAMPLGKESVLAALEAAQVDPVDVGLFVVATCTGYGTPGVDILLARDLGMPVGVQRLMVGHMGCYAALPALATAADATAARGLTSVVLCLELTSLHVQPATDEVQQMVAHALFSDAAASVVVRPDAAGIEVVDTIARTDVARADHMTWDVTDLGFRMGLSPAVPDILALHVRDVVDELLTRNGVALDDVRGWAVHPGGPRIVDVCAEQLGLDESAVATSREVLRDYGNCSSATVLLVLDRVAQSTGPGDHIVALAFGPGLTLYGTLLRTR